MMVVIEDVGQFYFVFPADVDTLRDTKPLEQADCSVQASSVNVAIQLFGKLVHRLGFMVLEQIKDKLSSFRNATAIVTEHFPQ